MNLLDCNGKGHSLITAEVPKICAPLFRPCVPEEKLKPFSSLQLANDYFNNRHVNVDILVGINSYWKFMLPNNVMKFENLVAHESVFGWVLSGSCTVPLSRESVSSQLLCINNVSESALHSFWGLESVGISPKEPVSDDNGDSNLLKKFSEELRYFNGRYEVALPWKSDIAKQGLKNNEKLAQKRLESLDGKFNKNPSLRERYDEVFREYEKDGIVEEVPSSEYNSPYPMFYLPHRPVVRECSNSTKVRPVFDASAVGYNGISLNDCLEC